MAMAHPEAACLPEQMEETLRVTERQLLRSITVLPVTDIIGAARWYEGSLGLQTTYLHEGATADEVTNYAVMSRDGLEVHLILDELSDEHGPWTRAGTGYLYLKVRDVEVLYEEVRSRGVTVARALQTENWGSRGFNLADPDGNTVHVEQE